MSPSLDSRESEGEREARVARESRSGCRHAWRIRAARFSLGWQVVREGDAQGQ